jgi:hypothetical protein
MAKDKSHNEVVEDVEVVDIPITNLSQGRMGSC